MIEKPRTKDDRNTLKIEFFKSDFDTVSGFFREKYGKKYAKKTTVFKKTKGRAKEKSEWKDVIAKRIINEMANDNVGKAKRFLDNMLQATMAHGQDLLMFDIGENGVKKIKGFEDLKEALATIEAVRTYLGLPNSYRDIGVNFEKYDEEEKISNEEEQVIQEYLEEKRKQKRQERRRKKQQEKLDAQK